MKLGPLTRRNRVAQRTSEPRPYIAFAQVACSPTSDELRQDFMITCHWSFESSTVSRTPFAFSIRVCFRGVKIDGTQKQRSPRRSASYRRSRVAIESSSVSSGAPTMRVQTGTQLLRFRTSRPASTIWGQ